MTTSGRLYTFDFDDNICSTVQCVRTRSHGRVTTKDYATLRAHVELSDDAFVEFSDALTCACPPYVKAPSWPKFVEAVHSRHPIAIITARANSSPALREYLRGITTREGLHLPSDVQIYCCGSKEFGDAMNIPEHAPIGAKKAAALLDFLHKHPDFRSVGYSDDDVANIDSIKQLFQQLEHDYPQARFITFVAK
jgi:hypothetical protein